MGCFVLKKPCDFLPLLKALNRIKIQLFIINLKIADFGPLFCRAGRTFTK